MGYLLQVVCSCTSLTDDKQIKDVPESNSPSGKKYQENVLSRNWLYGF